MKMANYIASEADIDLCQFPVWYPLLQSHSIKSRILEVDDAFVQYLGSEGLFLPSMSKTTNSTDEETVKDSLQLLHERINQVIRELGGEVMVKLNWSAPIDATWVNTNTAKCLNANEVFCLLKASDRIVFDVDKMYDLCANRTKSSPTQTYVVLRKWANLSPSMEFRMFILDKRLVGRESVCLDHKSLKILLCSFNMNV
jgi:hypothetical protein